MHQASKVVLNYFDSYYSNKFIIFNKINGTLLKDLADGKNVFYIDQEPANIRVLSKDVAMGGTHVSAMHCDDRDIIKISKIKKSEKIGEGCRCTVSFEF